MQKLVTKVVSFLLLAALLVSPVAAVAPERVAPPTDDFGLSAEDELWLETARMADSFTVQLVEPSLAAYEGDNALFAMPARTERGKLNFEAPETIAYLEYINSKLDAFISDAEALLGRDLEVLYRYDVVLNGFSAKMKSTQMKSGKLILILALLSLVLTKSGMAMLFLKVLALRVLAPSSVLSTLVST